MRHEYFDDLADEDNPELIADRYLQDDPYDSDIDPFAWDDYDCEEDREWDEYVGVRLDDKDNGFEYLIDRIPLELPSEPFDDADDLDMPYDSDEPGEFVAFHEPVELEAQKKPCEPDVSEKIVEFEESHTSDNPLAYSDPVTSSKKSPTLWETIYKIAFGK